MNKYLLSAHDKLLITQSITWLKTINEAQPAGSPQMDVNVSVDGSGKVTTAP